MSLYTPLSQRDGRWVNLTLGATPPAQGGTTIGKAGCFLVTATMMARHYGHDVLPPDVNQLVTAAGWWARDPQTGALNNWRDDTLSKLFGIQLEWANPYPSVPAPLGPLAMGDEEERLIVIHRPALGFDVHALRVFDVNPLVVEDPWWGDRVNFVSRYGADVATAITKEVGYRLAGFVPPWKQPPVDVAGLQAQLAAATAARDQARKELAAEKALTAAAGLVLAELLARAPKTP